jgi:catechol 2,3-dioxygenase-like lactoylglutathione lyase family enzyme
MQLNAVGVTSKDFAKTLKFYTLLGFDFEVKEAEAHHIESKTSNGSCKLMIDDPQIVHDIIGEDPRPSNCSAFALEFTTPKEIDAICKSVAAEGFKIVKEPWDAFWGQRYAIVEDPDGYKVDLYCNL